VNTWRLTSERRQMRNSDVEPDVRDSRTKTLNSMARVDETQSTFCLDHLQSCVRSGLNRGRREMVARERWHRRLSDSLESIL